MGRGREGTEMALLTSAICRAYAENACVPGTMQVAHPREGTDQQVGGSVPGRPLSSENSPDCASGTLQL